MKIKKYKAILLDGDGVLWKSDQPLDGINSLFEYLEEENVRWALLTNNNSHTVEHYVDKFSSMGIQAQPNSIFSSSTVTASYLLERYGAGASFHVIGNPGLIRTLQDFGFRLSYGENEPASEVAAVVAGMDIEINYQKITLAMRLIMGGASFIATNTDGSYPSSEGIYPATGMVIGAIQASTGVAPYVVGKPHPAIFKAALDELKSKPEDTLMVGDNLNTDILGANQFGIDSAAVLTGSTSQKMLKESTIKPTFIYKNIIALQMALTEVNK